MNMKRRLGIAAAMIVLAVGADWVNENEDLNGGALSIGTGLYSTGASVVITNSSSTQAEIIIANPSDESSGSTIAFKGTIAGNIKVVKKGSGTQNFTGSCLYSETVVESGTLYVSKEAAFGAWNADIAHKLTVCEGATFKSYRHLPLGEVVLKGGTLLSEMYSANVFNQTTPVSIVDPSSNYRAWALGTVTVEASATPSLIRAFTTSLAHGSAQTVFDVQENAELQLDVELFPGKLTDTEMNAGSFVKRGKGTLKLLKPCNLNGTIIVEDGALVVSKNTWHNPKLRIVTKGDGRIVMEDKAALVFSTAEGLLASADIWVDAAQHQTPTGTQISHIKNLGTAGGLFRPLVKDSSGDRCSGPDFVTDGIGGKPSFKFNRWRGMGLDTYTNKTDNLTVFMATQWGKYDKEHSGAASFSTVTATGADSDTTGSFHWERGKSVNDLTPLRVYFAKNVCQIENTGLAANAPTVKMMSRTASSVKIWSFINDSVEPTRLEEGDKSFGNFNIDVVAFGSRLGGTGYLKANGQNMDGLIGEMIVFTRVLNDDEIETIQTYLKRKWCGSTSEQTVKGFESVNPFNVEVGEGAKAVVMDGAYTIDDVMRTTTIKKSGAGTLAIGAIAGDKAKLIVDGGTLELKDGKTLPQAEIWMDASDATSVTTYETSGTRVAAIDNKGRTGGAFKYRDGSDGSVVNGPLYTTAANGINNKRVLDFSKWNALVLNTYTNKNEARDLHVYAVVKKPVWNWDDKQGSANSGPFSFSRVDTGESKGDGEISGVFYIMHKTHTVDCTQWTNVVDCGSTAARFDVFDRGWTNEAYIVICHATSKGIIYTQVTESDDSIDLPICPSYNQNIEPLNVDLVQIGGRLGPNGGIYGNNRLWQGQMGEFIVFNQKPTVEQETELINYLRRKWFNKGDGSETPPVCLTGADVVPVTTDSTALVLNEGATLRHEKGVQGLASLAAANNVTWQRPAATEGDFALFNVAGDIALAGVQTLAYDVSPKADMTLFTYGGACGMVDVSWVLTGPKGDVRKVKNFPKEKTVKVTRNKGFLLVVR